VSHPSALLDDRGKVINKQKLKRYESRVFNFENWNRYFYVSAFTNGYQKLAVSGG